MGISRTICSTGRSGKGVEPLGSTRPDGYLFEVGSLRRAASSACFQDSPQSLGRSKRQARASSFIVEGGEESSKPPAGGEVLRRSGLIDDRGGDTELLATQPVHPLGIVARIGVKFERFLLPGEGLLQQWPDLALIVVRSPVEHRAQRYHKRRECLFPDASDYYCEKY